MQPHTAAHQPGREEIAFNELTERENAGDDQHLNPVWPELHQRHADGQNAADGGAHIGDEAQKAGNEADGEPELEPGHDQQHRIENAKRQAHGALSANEAGKRLVDIAGDGADGLGMPAGNPLVDGGHHPVPVVEHVEQDNGRDHQQGNQIEQSHGSRPDGAGHSDDPLSGARGHVGRVGPVLQRGARERLLQPVGGVFVEKFDQSGDGPRQGIEQLPHLLNEKRHQHEQHDHAEHKSEKQYGACGHNPRHAPGFQLVGERIEKVGQHHPGDERRHDIAQKPHAEDQHGQKAKPEGDLGLETDVMPRVHLHIRHDHAPGELCKACAWFSLRSCGAVRLARIARRKGS